MTDIYLAITAIGAVVAFGLIGPFFYHFCKSRQGSDSQCLPPEECNYD